MRSPLYDQLLATVPTQAEREAECLRTELNALYDRRLAEESEAAIIAARRERNESDAADLAARRANTENEISVKLVMQRAHFDSQRDSDDRRPGDDGEDLFAPDDTNDDNAA